jgi:hypothetical protein
MEKEAKSYRGGLDSFIVAGEGRRVGVFSISRRYKEKGPLRCGLHSGPLYAQPSVLGAVGTGDYSVVRKTRTPNSAELFCDARHNRRAIWPVVSI